jgi:uncharacterized protein (TIGR02147 family)
VSQAPSPYEFHDIIEFLKASFDHKRSADKDFSLRSLSKQIGISVSMLPLILARRRGLSLETLDKIISAFSFADHEAVYLRSLRSLSEATDQNERLAALKRVQRANNYREHAPKEFETFQFLSKWYLPAIRELVGLEDFSPDPLWIQKRLRRRVSIKDIRSGWDFLVKHGFIAQGHDGRWHFPEGKTVECMGGVYKLSLGSFHKSMLNMAAESIEELTRDERDVQGFAIAVDDAGFEKVKDLITEFYAKVVECTSKTSKRKKVVYLGSVLFPLSKEKKT